MPFAWPVGMKSAAVLLLTTAAACADSTASPPGLAPPSCTMTWQAYRIDTITLPASQTEAMQFGLDLDRRPNDAAGGIDNALGTAYASLARLAERWDVNTALAAHLAAGRLHWLLEVGQCIDGDEIRTRLGRGADADGDGVFELDMGVPAVGTRAFGAGDAPWITALGTARVPVGTLTDGRGDLANDAWQHGFALTTDLRIGATGGATGKLGVGLGRFSDRAIEPLRAYATDAISDTGTGTFWRDFDVDHDGVISTAGGATRGVRRDRGARHRPRGRQRDRRRLSGRWRRRRLRSPVAWAGDPRVARGDRVATTVDPGPRDP